MTLFSMCRRRRALLFPVLFIPVLLSACGGGGSDSASSASGDLPGFSAPGDFRVEIDRREIAIDVEESSYFAPAIIRGKGIGDVPSSLYLGGDSGPDKAILDIVAEASGSNANFFVYPKPRSAPGTYRGILTLTACVDTACASHVRGSPVDVKYVVTVHPRTALAPSILQMQSVSGGTSTGDVVFRQSQDGIPTVTTSAPWITVSNITRSGFIVAAKSMQPGTHNGTVTVRSGAQTIQLPVRYEVVERQASAVRAMSDVASLHMSAVTGGVAAPRTINFIKPPGTSKFRYSLLFPTRQTSWLSSTWLNNDGSIQLTASAQSLLPGMYHAYVVLVADEVETIVPVWFTVNAG